MRLTVYVSPGCLGCDRAYRLVEELRGSLQSQEVVEVVDTTDGNTRLPTDLFAVPSWYVDGQIFSLGNPPSEHLHALIAQARFSEP